MFARFAAKLALIGVRVSPRPEKNPDTACVSDQNPHPAIRIAR